MAYRQSIFFYILKGAGRMRNLFNNRGSNNRGSFSTGRQEGFLRKQLLDIIEWEDNTQDTLLYKFPMQDNEIQNGGKLIVRESQAGVFMDKGVIADVFGPGTHHLTTENLPILGNLKGWAYGFKSPFKSDVYFVNTKLFVGQKWGTKKPIWIRDPEFGQFSVRSFGTFAFRVANPGDFVRNVSGTNQIYKVKNIQEQLSSFINSAFNNVIAKQRISVIDLAGNIDVAENAIHNNLADEFALLGLELSAFAIESINFPEKLEEAIMKRTEITALGGMQNYAQLETLSAMRESVKNPGMNSMSQTAMGLGMGLNFGNMFAQNLQGAYQNNTFTQPPQQPQQPQQTQHLQQQPPQPQPVVAVPHPVVEDMIVCSKCNAQIKSDSVFCSACGQKVEKPEPKVENNFCSKCGHNYEVGSKFCSKCGNPVTREG